MQKIVLFVEPIDETFCTSAKIGDMFMNRFAIDENASCEILKKLELGKTSVETSWLQGENYEIFAEERQQKGRDQFILIACNKRRCGFPMVIWPAFRMGQ